MSECPESTKILLTLDERSKILQNIRHELRKRRFVLDESRDKFGLDELSLLMKVKNTSEVKGYPFKASKSSLSVAKGEKIALKIVPIETKYDKTEHPCHLEHIFLKELTDNIVTKQVSPHIAQYLGVQKVSNKSRALKQLNLKRLEVSGKVKTNSVMLIAEYVTGGALDNWIFNTYENDKEILDVQWKNIVFQLIYTIAVMQKHYKMMHNDFHYGNILIDDTIKPGGYFVYEIDSQIYYIKNTGIIPKLWDFEFSMVYSNNVPESYPNKFITGSFEHDRKRHVTIVNDEEIDETHNVPFNYNEVYDLHYFLTSLLDVYISQELFDWILSLYPSELIPSDEASTDDSERAVSLVETQSYKSSHVTESSDDFAKSSQQTDNVSVWSTESSASTSSSSAEVDMYLNEKRLINGVEEQFKDLPTPLSILKNDFFESFTKVPADFKEEEAIYFKAGF